MRLKLDHYVFLTVLIVSIIAVLILVNSFTGFQTLPQADYGIRDIDFLGINPASFPSTLPLKFNVIVENNGPYTIQGGVLGVLLYDYNSYSLIASKTIQIPPLSVGGSTAVKIDFGNLNLGTYVVVASISAQGDNNPNNNEWAEQVIIVPACNNDDICDVGPGENSVNCPNDCGILWFDQQFCNNADYNDGIILNQQSTFTDSYGKTHSLLLKSVDFTSKSVTVDYDGNDLSLNLRTPKTTSDYEIKVTRIIKNSAGGLDFAHVCMKVKRPATPQVDLAIDSISFSPSSGVFTEGDKVIFNVEISNLGSDQTKNTIDVLVDIMDNAGNLIRSDASYDTSGLGVGQSMKFDFSFANLPAGFYNVKVNVHNVDDTNTANNEDISSFTINPRPPSQFCGNGVCDTGEDPSSCPQDCTSLLPDLEATAQLINVNPNQIPENTPFDVRLDFENIGRGTTLNPPEVGIEVFDSRGVSVYKDISQYPNNLDPGDKDSVTFSLVSGNAGDYLLKVGVDPKGQKTGDASLQNNVVDINLKVIQTTPPPSQCNNNGICDADKGEDSNNCPNDCSLGNDKQFCNNANYNGAIMLNQQSTFIDSYGKTHSLLLKSVDVTSKSVTVDYDGTALSLNLRITETTSDYEIRVPIIGKDLSGQEFAYLCMKVKGLAMCGNGACDPGEDHSTCPQDCPSPPSQCNNNGICEVNRGENINNCASDCTSTSQAVQFCNPQSVDLVKNLEMGRTVSFRDQYGQPHTFKFESVNKPNKKIIVKYDGKKVELEKGKLLQTTSFDVMALLIEETIDPLNPQSTLIKGYFCAKHNQQVSPPLPHNQQVSPPLPIRPPVAQLFNVDIIVQDKQTKQPVEGAKVSFFVYISVTDNTGKVSFKSVPKQKIKYKITKQGYKTVEGELDVQKSQTYKFELEKLVSVPESKILVDSAQIIVGKKAPPRDVFTAEILKKKLAKNVIVELNEEPVVKVGVIPSSDKISSKVILDDVANVFTPGKHSIVVGNACNNKITKVMLEIETEEECDKDLVPGQARIKLKTLHNGKNIVLLVYGSTEEDTRMAVQALVSGLPETVSGKDFIISKINGEIKVTKLG